MSFDTKLRRRIAWLNNAGGFENGIKYAKVSEASEGVDDGKVMDVLSLLESSWQKVEDPTAWVCAALHKSARGSDHGRKALGTKGSGGKGKGGVTNGWDDLDWDFGDKLRRRIAWLNNLGGFENSIMYSKVAEVAASVDGAKVMEILKHLEDNWDKVKDPTAWVCSSLHKSCAGELDVDFDSKLRTRIAWLNNAGGFENMIMYTKVAEAAVGLQPSKVMEMLKFLEESWEVVEDPTAWVCTALRKAGGGGGFSTSSYGDYGASGKSRKGAGKTGYFDGGYGLSAEFDDKLRRRIAWLNTAGGFENFIIYSKVAEAADGVDDAKVLEKLKYLEENWEKVNDPTAWVCSALRRGPAEGRQLDSDLDSKLRRRVAWLNNTGGFENSIIYSKVAEAAVGLDTGKVMEVLRYLEESWESVEDPTAWACTALRKAGGGGGGGYGGQAWTERY